MVSTNNQKQKHGWHPKGIYHKLYKKRHAYLNEYLIEYGLKVPGQTYRASQHQEKVNPVEDGLFHEQHYQEKCR